jgi:hypothetical protein
MRKLILGLLAAGTAIAAASPAVAQYQQPYGAPYGNAYGHNGGNWGQMRSLQARIDNVQRQIRRFDRRDAIRDDRADRLRSEANQIENRLHRAARNGLNRYEANELGARIARLEQRVQYSLSNRGYANNGQYRDRDRDGRNDRWEDDQGRRHDR